MNYRIYPPEEMLMARVQTPPSKSIVNRLIVINALTEGHPETPCTDVCADTRALAGAIQADRGEVNVGASGTAMRLLTAYFAAREGADVTLDGVERMHERPVGPLVEALRSLGADIEYAGEEGFPPLRIRGRRLTGGRVTIDSTVSSQFISALMLVAPTMAQGLVIDLDGLAVSMPYIKMSLGLLQRHGIAAEMDRDVIPIPAGEYIPVDDEQVEADWSAATFWYEIAAISAGFVTLDGLEHPSLQGDAAAAQIFEGLGVTTDYEGEEGGFDLAANPDPSPRLHLDLSDHPDMLPAIVVAACMLGIPFRITGLENLHAKECDRVEAIVNEMRKIGAMVQTEGPGILTWELQRRPIAELPVFDTYGDHRMAMAMAPVSLFLPGIVVRDAEVVEKSYPGYWTDLQAAGFRLEEWTEEMGTDAAEAPADGPTMGPKTDSIGI